MSPAASLSFHKKRNRPSARMQLAYMTSHTQSELGLGDSQGSVLLTTPAAPLTLDKNTNDIAACDIRFENTKCSGPLWEEGLRVVWNVDKPGCSGGGGTWEEP